MKGEQAGLTEFLCKPSGHDGSDSRASSAETGYLVCSIAGTEVRTPLLGFVFGKLGTTSRVEAGVILV